MVLKQFRSHKAGSADKFRWLIRLGVDDDTFRQTEVSDLGNPLMRQDDVVWLQVAMQNSGDMCCCQSFRDSQRQGGPPHRGLCPVFFDQFPQRTTCDKFHFDEVETSFFTNGMNGHDVGMVQSGCRLALIHEPGDIGGITFCQGWWKNFESTFSPQITMTGQVNPTHRPCPEQCFDIINAKWLTDQLVDFCRLRSFRSGTLCSVVRVHSFMKNRISKTIDF